MENIFEEYDIISVMPDYGGAYLWGKLKNGRGIGVNIADSWGGYADYLPISEALQLQFHEWQRQFERVDFYDDESKINIAYTWQGEQIAWDWEQYHAEGLRLAKYLKQEIGNQCQVHYVKPYEDFYGTETAVEILSDGNVRVLSE